MYCTFYILGVLLLNSILTVEQDIQTSHANKGLEIFTNAIIKQISDNMHGVVFMLCGIEAQKKQTLIEQV